MGGGVSLLLISLGFSGKSQPQVLISEQEREEGRKEKPRYIVNAVGRSSLVTVNSMCTLVELKIKAPLNHALQLAVGAVPNLRHLRCLLQIDFVI